MKLFNIFILAFFSVALVACGGAEERKAVYLEKAKVSMAAGDLNKARIELKNVLQIDPKDANAYYQLGNVYEQQKKYRKAFTNYLKSSELDPDLLENQARLGRFYLLLANDLDKAQEKIDFILLKEPDNIEGLLLKAAMRLKKGDMKQAIDIAKVIVSREPGHIDGVTFLASLYLKEKKNKDAIEILDVALKSNHNNESLNRLLAVILMEDKEFDRAESIYKDFLERNPDSSASYNNLALFYSQIGKQDKVEEVLRASVKSNPEDVDRALALVKYIRSTQGDNEAVNVLRELIAKNNNVGKLRIALGQLFAISGDKDSAVDVFKEAINDFSEEETGIESRILLATIYITKQDYTSARKILDEADKISPNDPKINFLKAKLAVNDGDIESATISLRVVIKEMPENIDAYLLLARVYESEGNKDQARDILNSAYANNKMNAAGLLKLSEYYLSRDIEQSKKIIADYNNLKKFDYDGMSISATILNRQKLYSEAYIIAEKLMELFPDKTAGYFHSVPYLIQQGNKEKAISVLEQGYEKSADSRILLVLLTKLQVSEKQFDEAAKRILDELKNSPDDSDLKIILAKIYIVKGDLLSAESLLREVVKADPALEEPYLLLAQIYQKQQNILSVKSILEKGRANVASSIKIPLRLATAYEFNKEYSKTIKVYSDLNKQFPDNLIVINNLVSMLSDYGEKNDLELAKQLVLKLENTKQYVFMDTIGWLYYKLGDYEQAIKYLSQSVEKAPNVSVFNYHLGMAYMKSGAKSKARKYLENSMSDGKNFKEKPLAEAALESL